MQAGILDPVPAQARHVFFSLHAGVDPVPALRALAGVAGDGRVVAGIGTGVASALRRDVPGLRAFPAFPGKHAVPATQHALWCWLRAADGEDGGHLLQASRRIEDRLASAFGVAGALNVFRHDGGRDLTGYEDGTENPHDDDAVAAAITRGLGAGFDGASFAAFQQWQHDFASFEAIPADAQDNAIGRRRSDNGELADAPASAHVKRTAQEDFDPEAFVVRRSMPWIEGARAGLAFLAFGKSFDAFEAQMRRMTGEEDGIVDALFGFSRPLTGAYFWCPPVRKGRLDLRGLGID